jgi:hypothetical protein
MNFYWVNVGKTFNEATKESFLWAPNRSITQAGLVRRVRHWEVVSEIKEGDIIFCANERYLTKVAVAISDAYKATRPASRKFRDWNKDGNRVDVAFNSHIRPVLKQEVASDFIPRFNQFCDPPLFNINGTLNQLYMSKLSPEAGLFLLEMTGAITDLLDQLIDEGGKKVTKETTKEIIALARIGHGRFRSDLIRRWNGKCCLTGLDIPELLVASHIFPWISSTNEERLDPDNGLLLAAHIDKLFDRGLISFNDDGNILISDLINSNARHILGISEELSIGKLTPGVSTYMRRHRERYKYEN